MRICESPEIKAKLQRRRRVQPTMKQRRAEEMRWKQQFQEYLKVSTREYYDRLINDPELEKDDLFKQEVLHRELGKEQLQKVFVSSKLLLVSSCYRFNLSHQMKVHLHLKCSVYHRRSSYHSRSIFHLYIHYEVCLL